MELDRIKYIETLVEKYYEAQTSLEEEKELKNFFTNEEVPPHLLMEKAQFTYFKNEQSSEENITIKKITQPNKKDGIYKLMNYAAAAILLISAGWFSNNKYQSHIEHQKEVKIAYAETQKAFNILSGNLQIGISNVEALKELNVAQSTIINNKY